MIAQHVMICIYNFIMVYAFGTTLGKLCMGALSVADAVAASANAFIRLCCCKALAHSQRDFDCSFCQT